MHILLIRPGAIGDALLTFPLIHMLRTRYTQAQITLVSNAAVLPLALDCGLVEAVSSYEDTCWGRLFLDAPASEPDAILASSDVALCWLRDSEGVVERNLRAAGVQDVHVAPGRPEPGERVHVVEHLARTAGLPWLPELLAWSLFPPSPAPPGAYFAVHPGSGGAHKCWPAGYFAEVIAALWRSAIPVLLLAGPADSGRLSDLLALLGLPPHPALLKKMVDFPLLEVARQLRQCRGYLGNDSGITHLAAMLGLPTTVLFGPSDPAIWRPVGPLVKVLQEPDLHKLSVSAVLLAMRVENR